MNTFSLSKRTLNQMNLSFNFRYRCWLESSFVGLKPVDSPQTPVIETSNSTFSNLNNSGNNDNKNSISNNATLASKINTSNTSGMNGGLDGESSFII